METWKPWQKWALGIGGTIVGITIIYFIGVGAGLWKNIFSSDKEPDQIPPSTDPNAPNACDPNRVGYLKNGTKNSDCGQAPCHPYKDGYDEQGFPDVNCEKLRTQNPNTRTQPVRWNYYNVGVRKDAIGEKRIQLGGGAIPPDFKVGDKINIITQSYLGNDSAIVGQYIVSINQFNVMEIKLAKGIPTPSGWTKGYVQKA